MKTKIASKNTNCPIIGDSSIVGSIDVASPKPDSTPSNSPAMEKAPSIMNAISPMAKPTIKLLVSDKTMCITGVFSGMLFVCGNIMYERERTRKTFTVVGINLPDSKGVIMNIPVILLISIPQLRNCVSTKSNSSITLLF